VAALVLPRGAVLDAGSKDADAVAEIADGQGLVESVTGLLRWRVGVGWGWFGGSDRGVIGGKPTLYTQQRRMKYKDR